MDIYHKYCLLPGSIFRQLNRCQIMKKDKFFNLVTTSYINMKEVKNHEKKCIKS